MGRKPRIQARGQRIAKPPRAGKRIYQCLLCGALTDPIYGAGDDSWCPSCQKSDQIAYAEGEIPFPALYGGWVARQKKQHKDAGTGDPVRESPTSVSDPFYTAPTPSSKFGGFDMQIPQYHTGSYHCPTCCMDFELFAETVLKCNQCGGRLVKGSLDDDPKHDRDTDA